MKALSSVGKFAAAIAVLLWGTTAAASLWTDQPPPEAKTFKVLEVLDPDAPIDYVPLRPVSVKSAKATQAAKADRSVVVIDAGRKDGMLSGSTLRTYRRASRSGAWIETGVLKAVEVQDSITIAKIEKASGPMSATFFPEFPEIMGGDYAILKQLQLTRRQTVTPTTKLGYYKIFADPKRQPRTFELSHKGRQVLAEAARAFAESRVSLLMVEGYTDHRGPAAENQVESYQRALTVRQFLIDELGFDDERVIAVGYGEAEPENATSAPGFEAVNRRIVLKAATGVQ